MTRHRSSASPLAGLYAALIVYASLYPFTGWRDSGLSPWAFLALGWPRWWTGFDLVANLLGYIPLGVLVFGALVRTGSKARAALLMAFAGGLVLSLAMELLQNFLPKRVSSNLDLALNALGALLGAVLGWAIHRYGGVDRWQSARDRWFIRRSAGALALLLLWPMGLLLPLPVPLGVGQVLARVQEAIADGVQGTVIAPAFESWMNAEANRAALSPVGEFSLIALGLLAPCMVAFSVVRPGWRRLVLAFGAAALGGAVTTLSTALNFGPEHALAWGTPQALAALAVGISVAALLSAVPPRAAAGLGLMALTALVTIIAQAPADPYFAQSLSLWEQGRFIRFHGAARWVGWLWPYAAIVYLLARLGARGGSPPPSLKGLRTDAASAPPKMKP